MQRMQRRIDWFLAVRPWSFVMTLICVTTGSVLGAADGPFSPALYLLTLAGTVFLHAGANFINDYYDVASGVDTRDAATARYRPHPLAEGSLSLPAVAWAAAVLVAAGASIGLFLGLTRGWPILLIGMAGAFAGIFYTAPPFRYKYSALGETAAFLAWGPLMVSGAAYVQGQSFSAATLLVSIPLGVLVALVLLANNIRDVDSDGRHAIRTIPLLLGKTAALRLYLALIVAAYGAVLVMAVLGPLTAWSLLVLLSLPVAVSLARATRREFPVDADPRTAQMVTVFGGLLLLSLLLERAL